MKPNSVLLPKVWPVGFLKLGSLVGNPRILNDNPFIPPEKLLDQFTRNPQVDPIEVDYLSINKKGWFDLQLSKILGAGFHNEANFAILLENGELITTEFGNVRKAFAEVVTQSETRKWLEEMSTGSDKAFFMTGIQEVKGATCTKGVSRGVGGKGYLELPIEEMGKLAARVISGFDLSSLGISRGPVNGIIGIKVQKVKIQVRNESQPAALRDGISWVRSFEADKGEERVETCVIEVVLDGEPSINEIKIAAAAYDDEEDEEGT